LEGIFLFLTAVVAAPPRSMDGLQLAPMALTNEQ
jgi:hypothetical protein